MLKTSKVATDNELVELSKQNPDAFGELVSRYQKRLFLYIRRSSYFSNEDIEDIIQETFIKVYRSLNIFDGDLKFSTWIYQIARNTMIDAIRKKQIRPQTVFFEEDDTLKFFKADIDIQAQIENKDQVRILQELIDDLPYRYKEVLILRFLEDKNYDEIMDIIQKPKGTVAALISRGRKKLLDAAHLKLNLL
ncbi:MAG: sigma-70 family RNA polymerase sigma factor [Parcubacteria group bacterium]|jgi:RNA polymerase sigma-70 factor (ECF subfamily)